jgi:PAS domain-containing protein
MDPSLGGLPQWQALAVAPLASAASTRGQLVFGSEAFFELMRWTPEQLTRQSWLEVMFPDPDERALMLGEVMPLYQTGGVLRHRINAMCGDGVRRLFELTTTAISMPDGSPGLMAILVDSSGLAMPVGGGERSIENLVEDAPDIMMRVDAQSGRMLYVNRSIERLTGYTPEELYQNADLFASIILPEQRPAWEASFSRLQEISARTFDLTVTA